MVLLKLSIQSTFKYILCYLHSTMVLLKSFTRWVRQAVANISTFHYGSIKIVVNRSIVVKNNTSTFHYGSIKMWFYDNITG